MHIINQAINIHDRFPKAAAIYADAWGPTVGGTPKTKDFHVLIHNVCFIRIQIRNMRS
jgi:hypothetical protein